MRDVFMVTQDIAATCLKKILADGFQVVGVYTQPDRPKGRGMKLVASPVKLVAQEAGIPVFQPENFREEEMDALLGNFSSLSYSLAGKGVSHVAAWYDDAAGELRRCRIDDEEGTYAMVDQLLAAVPYGWQYDIENGYDKEYPGEVFAAILIFDTEGKLQNNGRVIAEFGTEGQEQQVIV